MSYTSLKDIIIAIGTDLQASIAEVMSSEENNPLLTYKNILFFTKEGTDLFFVRGMTGHDPVRDFLSERFITRKSRIECKFPLKLQMDNGNVLSCDRCGKIKRDVISICNDCWTDVNSNVMNRVKEMSKENADLRMENDELKKQFVMEK